MRNGRHSQLHAVAPVPARQRRGGILRADVYTLPAYLAGDTLQRASGRIDLVIGGAAVLAVAAVLVIVRRQAAKLARRAETVYPSPFE